MHGLQRVTPTGMPATCWTGTTTTIMTTMITTTTTTTTTTMMIATAAGEGGGVAGGAAEVPALLLRLALQLFVVHFWMAFKLRFLRDKCQAADGLACVIGASPQ